MKAILFGIVAFIIFYGIGAAMVEFFFMIKEKINEESDDHRR
jgi:hypothetical protein